MGRLSFFLPLIVLLASGCASVSTPPPEHDPYERFNRSVYRFNDTLDRAVLKPVAQGYEKVMPQPVDDSVSNFFSNLDDVTVTLNDLLQGKFHQATSDLSRLVWNTTLGIGGLFDVATHFGLPKHNEDFGQTLGAWGVESGPYLVLPFFGPSTFRDTAALPVDWVSEPLYHYYPLDKNGYWQLKGLYYIDQRAGLLRASRLMEQAALDEYVFMREAFLQRRQSLVYDGNPPLPDFDLFDEESEEELPETTPPQ
ncbi:MAG TPA: VacJ family lipoprotein [Gammaproteobacteria bacterium]